MILTEEKKRNIEAAYEFMETNRYISFGTIKTIYNLTSTEVYSINIALGRRISLKSLLSRLFQVQNDMLAEEIELILRGNK